MIPAESQGATATQKRPGGSDLIDLLVFLVPCLEFFQIKAIGVLFGPELLLLVILIFLAFRMRIRINTRSGKTFMILCSLWLVAQCVTDILRHSAFRDYARGWSNIGMTLGNFAVLYTLLYGRPRRLIFYGWGLVVGGLLSFLISPDIYAASDPWKFGIGFPVTLATFLFVSRSTCRSSLQIALSLTIGVINIGLGDRSVGGVCLVTALYLFVSRTMARKTAESPKLKAKWMLAFAALIIIGFAGVLWAYQFAASAGVLGEDARVKYENQSSGRYGILLGGRVEMLGYLPAIYDSPIFGHGSWAKDPTYLIAEHQALALMGYSTADEVSPEDFEEGLIPTHSYLFGAWVDAGVLGAIFWAWVFVLDAKTLMRVYPPTTVLLPVMSYIGFELLWDVVFSPYGAEVRIIFPFYIVMLMTCSDMMPSKAAMVMIGGAKQRPAQATV